MDDWKIADYIALGSGAITFVAVILAPLIALWIGMILQRRSDASKEKLKVLATLISLRHDPLASDAIQSLNLIDVVFVNDLAVREAWTRYFAVLNDASLNVPVGYSLREEKRRELLLAMIQAVGVGERLSSADLLRTYTPQPVGERMFLDLYERQLKILDVEKALDDRGIKYTPVTGINRPPKSEQH